MEPGPGGLAEPSGGSQGLVTGALRFLAELPGLLVHPPGGLRARPLAAQLLTAKLLVLKLLVPEPFVPEPFATEPFATEPFAEIVLSPEDRSSKALLAIDCSWNLAKEVFFKRIGGKHRRLPALLAANPTNYSKLGILSSVEAVAASLYIGAYVLSFFGISIPVLRVAGGIIVSMSGWRMLNEPDATEQRRSEAPAYPRSIDAPPSRLAFYPLTMPLTTGPGTISVAISIGAGRPPGFHAALIAFFLETLAAALLLVLLIYLLYRHSARIADFIGPTGTTIIVRCGSLR